MKMYGLDIMIEIRKVHFLGLMAVHIIYRVIQIGIQVNQIILVTMKIVLNHGIVMVCGMI